MPYAVALLVIAGLLFPPGALAQNTGPLSMPLPPPAAPLISPLLPTRPQIEELHRRTRERMLACLAPAHRALFANLVGELVTAKTPDVPAAVRRIDATLTAAEAQAIARAQNDELEQAEHIVNAAVRETRPGTRRPLAYLRRAQKVDPGRSLLRAALLIGAYEQR